MDTEQANRIEEKLDVLLARGARLDEKIEQYEVLFAQLADAPALRMLGLSLPKVPA